MSGYTRQQSYIDGDVILAEHTNDEFDALAEAFSTTLGHKHDGTTAEGPTIDIISDNDGDTRITVEAAADEDNIRFFTAATERLTIADTGNITFLKDSFFNAPTTHALLTTFNGEVRFNSDPVTFNVKPSFDGGLSGVSAPFTVDSTFLVTNLNADLLDGQQGSFYTTGTNITAASTTARGTVELATNAETITGTDTTRAVTPSGLAATYTAADVLTKIKTVDGAASGLDADLLDGVQGSDYMRLDQSNVFSVPGYSLRSSTNDGADTSLLSLNGGGGISNTSRGAYIILSGNEEVNPGRAYIASGITGGIELNAAGTGNSIIFSITGSEKARIDSSGNVGIGTNSPQDQLHIKKGDSGVATFASNTNVIVEDSGNAAIQFATPNTQNQQILFSDPQSNVAGVIQYNHSSDAMTFNTNGSERARIDSSGNVGIGTTSPSTALNIGAGGVFRINSSSGSGYLQIQPALTSGSLALKSSQGSDTSTFLDFDAPDVSTAGIQYRFGRATNTTGNCSIALFAHDGSGSTSLSLDDSGTISAGSGSSNLIKFNTSGLERARIDSSGSLLVGTTSTNLSTDATGTGFLYNTGGILTIARDAHSANAPAVHINKTSYVSGTTYHILFRENGTIRGSVTSNGSTTSYNTTSDYRLKENVVVLDSAIDRVKVLKPSRFNFIGREETIDGFLAHEVQAVVPEAVSGNKDAVDPIEGPQYQVMDASKLVPLLTAALKESIDHIEALEEKIAGYEKDLITYDKRLVALENK